MTKLALIGVGRWGKNILRTLEGIKGVEVTAFDTATSPSPSPHLRRGEFDGVLIATPGSTHAQIALPYIKRGLPVFIEKPMTTRLKDAVLLERAAQKSGSSIFVGHVHLYNPAYLKLKQLLPKVGTVKLIHFEGMAPGPVRDDMSVLWDWGPHGVSMMLDLVGAMPQRAQAWGPAFVPPKAGLRRGKARDFAHTVMAKLDFPGNIAGTMHLSWSWPEKRVKLTVVGSRGSLVFDDTADRKVTFYRNGRVTHPRYGGQQPLTRELAAFIRIVQIVQKGQQPKTDARQGVDVVRALSACERSLVVDGRVTKC